MNTGTSKPSIFFATIAAGGGHVATAWAMAEAIESLYPGRFGLRVSDYMKEVGAKAPGVADLDRRHKDTWKLALRYPVLARVSQRLMDAFPRLTVAGQRRVVREFARAAAEDLRESPPSLVVSNHGLLTAGFVVARHRYGLGVPVISFATEPHNVGAYWAEPDVDRVVAPSEETRRNLVRFGVPEDRIEVVGYPVRQAFLNAPGKAEARARLGLDDRFTCLLAFGGEGVGKDPLELVRTLLNSGMSIRVIAITGRNEALRDRLKRVFADADGLRVEGFVEDVATYLAASDVFVGKAGPASVYEAVAVGRPVLVTGHAALNELGVAQFVERRGLGRYVKTPGALLEEVRRYASRPASLEEVALRCRDVDLADETGRLARHVVGYVTGGGGNAA